MFLIDTPPPFFEGKKINGLLFDSFSLVHCGFGNKGEMGALLSHWIQHDPSLQYLFSPHLIYSATYRRLELDQKVFVK